jgi:hypothetical protein
MPDCVTQLKQLKTGIVEVDNATSASSVVVSSLNSTALGVSQTRSSSCASRGISLVLGLRGIERVTEVHYTTVLHWRKRSWTSTGRCSRGGRNPRSN